LLAKSALVLLYDLRFMGRLVDESHSVLGEVLPRLLCMAAGEIGCDDLLSIT